MNAFDAIIALVELCFSSIWGLVGAVCGCWQPLVFGTLQTTNPVFLWQLSLMLRYLEFA